MKSFTSGQGSVTGSHEYDNKTFGIINDCEFNLLSFSKRTHTELLLKIMFTCLLLFYYEIPLIFIYVCCIGYCNQHHEQTERTTFMNSRCP